MKLQNAPLRFKTHDRDKSHKSVGIIAENVQVMGKLFIRI